MRRRTVVILVLLVLVAVGGGFIAGAAYAAPEQRGATSEFAELEQVMSEDFPKMYEYLGKQQNDQVGLRIEKARGRIKAYIERMQHRIN
jgi:division protein CdvB (Snf7/Vps24/ESCRT-III family)